MDQEGNKALKRDILLCLFLIAVGGMALVSINSVKGHNVGNTQTLSFSTLPNAYAALLVIFSVVILLGSALKLRKADQAEPKADQAKDDHEPVAARSTIVLRTWGTWAPFLLLTTAFLAALFVLFGQRSPLKVAGIAILGGVGFHLLFIVGLNLPI
jgi:Na+-driven multidrug efflux pump